MADYKKMYKETIQRKARVNRIFALPSKNIPWIWVDDMKPDDMIFGHEFYCVGGVTIHGVIGIRDYTNTTYEIARYRYINETKLKQAELGFTSEQMISRTEHRTNCVRF